MATRQTQAVEQLLQTINTSTAAWKAGDELHRNEIVSACFKLARELEMPSDFFVRTTWEYPTQLAALRTAIDLDLFHHINAEGAAKSTPQLADAVKADPALMTRILRVLASIDIVREIETDQFTSTPLSMAFVDPDHISAMTYSLDFPIPANLRTAAYLQENKYQNPSDMTNTPMQFVHGGKGEMNIFQLLHKFNYVKGFENVMKAWTKDAKHWSDDKAGFYPFQERLIDGTKTGSDEVFLVNVGGG